MPNIIVNSLIIMFIVSMMVIAIFGILKKKTHYSLNFTVGIFTVILGVLISYLIISFSKTEYEILIEIVFQIFPIWIILYGIYELINGIDLLKTTRN